MKRQDRGSVTIWVLGLSMLLLLFGGLALDYWRALATQRELAAVADSAALAAASGVDESVYRESGEIVLDPVRARGLAAASVSWQNMEFVSVEYDIEPGLASVTLTTAVELGLLGLFVDQDAPLTVRASAAATPVLIP